MMGDQAPNAEGSGGASGSKKRVRFREDICEVRLYQPDEPQKRQVILLSAAESSMDPMETLEQLWIGRQPADACHDGPEMDPTTAAARRATARREHIMSIFGDTDDADYTADWDRPQSAEEEGGDEEQRFTEEGIPIEPFHMRLEREEGYFDDETGNYVEWKREEEDDTWIDELPNAPVDASWVAKLLTQGNHMPTIRPDEGDLSRDEVRGLKYEIISMLHPGEMVLDALKRLARYRLPANPSATTPSSNADAQHSTSGRKAAVGKMPPAVQTQFDRLTDLSTRIMDSGDYLIHTTNRERILEAMHHGALAFMPGGEVNETHSEGQGGVLAQHLLAAAAAAQGRDIDVARAGQEVGGPLPGSTPSHHLVKPVDEATDMFADEDVEVDGTENNIVKHNTDDAVMEEEHHHQGGAAGGRSSSEEHPSSDQQQEKSSLNLPSGKEMDLDGFILDRESGYLYNTALGAYYDPKSGLFGDAASGRWYSTDANGQYILVE